MRFKKWLKQHLRQWLFKEELNRINELGHRTDSLINSIKHNEELIKTFLATCQTGYDLGVSEYHRNWCVFARKGKTEKHPDFVKFIDLSHLTFEHIKGLEKELEKLSRYRDAKYSHIDAPLGVKDYFIF